LQGLLQILISHGFLINVPKSILSPAQSLVFIGGHFLTDRNMISLPRERELDFEIGPVQDRAVCYRKTILATSRNRGGNDRGGHALPS
jgi:hypothetical protein